MTEDQATENLYGRSPGNVSLPRSKSARERQRYQEKGGKERMRANHLKRTYGITPEQYAWLKRRQNNLCAICGRPETKTHKSGEPYELAVDHDHTTGAVRGLLCSKCNQAIGLMQDDTTRLQAAIRYLRKPTRQLPDLKPVKKTQPPLIRIIAGSRAWHYREQQRAQQTTSAYFNDTSRESLTTASVEQANSITHDALTYHQVING